MRIAVYHNLPSGGAKRALHELTRVLGARHSIDVFTLETADHGYADLRPLSRSHQILRFKPLPLFETPFGRLNQISRTLDLWRLRRLNHQLARQVDAADYDAVLVNPCQFENSPSILQFLHTKTVYYCQEPLRRLYERMPERPYTAARSSRGRLMDRLDPFPALYRSRLGSGDRRSLVAADRVVVNSKFIQRSVKDIYGAQATVLYLGVDTAGFAPGSDPDGKYVLSVGSLTPLKGFDFVLRALATIPKDIRPALRIVCNFEIAEERAYLLRLAAELDAELEILTGITDQRLAECYRQAIVTAYAPIREPFGLVAIESMACGTPVVGIREGGIPETVDDGSTGFLVERDPALFGRAIEKLVKDEGLRAQMGALGRNTVIEKWTWTRAADQLETILRD